MSLIDKLRKARESVVLIDRFSFTIKRPTDMEVSEFRGQQLKQSDLLGKFVIGWNVTELDIDQGGTNIIVPFDSSLFVEWIADQPKLWSPLTDAILDSYRKHQEARENELGKLDAG